MTDMKYITRSADTDGGWWLTRGRESLATIVNQEEANRDRRKLLSLKRSGIARSIGVSYEPSLGPVDWWPFLVPDDDGLPPMDWLIVGGESTQGKHKARPFNVFWARDAIQQARGTACAVFIKQVGSTPEIGPGNALESCKDKAGADPDEWPRDIRVREYPVIGGSNG